MIEFIEYEELKINSLTGGKNVTRPTLHKSQQFIRDSKKRINVISAGRRFGKTTMMMDEAVFEPNGIFDGKNIGWCSPTKSLIDEAFDYVITNFEPYILSVSYRNDSILFKNGARFDLINLYKEKMPGHGKQYAKLFFDEAAFAKDLRNQWLIHLSLCLMDHNGEAWFASTQSEDGEFFKELCRAGDSGGVWVSHYYKSTDNTTIKNIESFVDVRRKFMQENVFAREYLGFPG